MGGMTAGIVTTDRGGSSGPDFFPPGRIVNPMPTRPLVGDPVGRVCRVVAPGRVATFLCHHDYFNAPPRPSVYPIGDVNFVVDRHTVAVVQRTQGAPGETTFDIEQSRRPLAQHVVLLMRDLLDIDAPLRVTTRTMHGIRHGGLASSSSLQGSIALAINELWGAPVPRPDLARYLSQNYGEECGDEGLLVAMPSLGGGCASAMLAADAITISCDDQSADLHDLPDDISVVLAVPTLVTLPDGGEDFALFRRGADLFTELGRWGDVKREILETDLVPALRRGDTSTLFRHINSYSMGAYGPIPGYFANRWANHGVDFLDLSRSVYAALRWLLDRDEACFFVSSGGPSIAILTRDPEAVTQALGHLPLARCETLGLHRYGPTVELW